MFESVYLTMLVKPIYEKPIDTAEDIIDSGLNILAGPGTHAILELMKNSPSIIAQTFAERTIVAEVIFSYIYPILVLKFPDRIMMTMLRGLKMRLLRVLLLLNVPICTTMS